MSDLPPRFQPARRSNRRPYQPRRANGARRNDEQAGGGATGGTGGAGEQPPAITPRRAGGRPQPPRRRSITAAQAAPPPAAPAGVSSAAPLPPVIAPKSRRAPQPPPRPVPVAAQHPNVAPAPFSHPSPSAPPLPSAPAPAPLPARRRRKRHPGRWLVIALVALLAWPVGLAWWANSQLRHVNALSGAAATPGTTFLLAGSDSRADGEIADNTEGARTDSILLLHRAPNGQTVLVSLPRDTYVQIPNVGGNKLNAAYAFGGAPLLVQTVENLTGMTVDHYVEVGMGGVREIVDAVGGVNLCLDFDVNDEKSELEWKAGCHDANGATALAFSRMRYSDPRGDMGRQDRQRQVISAVVKQVANPSFALNPLSQRSAVRVGTDALTVDENASIFTLVSLARYFRAATGANMHGHPPIASYSYQPGGIGAAVLLDAQQAPAFFEKMRAGTLTPADLQVEP